MKTKCGQLIPNFKKHPEDRTKHSWEDYAARGHQFMAYALNVGLFVGSLALTTHMVLLFASGLQIILSKQKF